MTNNINKIDEAFDLCSNNLGNLPSKYKKWRTLFAYRKDWSFIKNRQILERICEGTMALDYLYSLLLWLEPGLTLGYAHKFLCVQNAVSIIEAVLFDYLCRFINETKDTFLKDELSKSPSNKIRYILKKKGILDSYWDNYIEELSELRNYIHLTKTGIKFYEKIDKVDVCLLIKKINSFRVFMRINYR